MASTSFYARSMAVLGIMWGLVFAFLGGILYLVARDGGIQFAGLAFSPIVFAIIISLIFLLLQFVISPFLMDLQLRWIYDMSWVLPQDLPEDMFNALTNLFDKHGFYTEKIGIIHDGTPNAFTYGHFKNNARIVITDGLMEMLDSDERVAVLTHEVGHIVHLDFVFMTVAQALPLMFYYIYISSRSFGEMMSRSSNNQKNPAPVFFAVAFISYIIYFISGYIVLLLSRYRENFADAFAAVETGQPNAMSSALVKVAYGLVVADSKNQSKLQDDNIDKSERRSIRRRQGFNHAMRTMGLADVNTAKGLVMQAYGKDKEVSPEAVAAAASWDLETPWAKFLELSSTHPLTGKRLKNLDDLATDLGQQPKYPTLGQVKIPESLLDEFLTDLFLQYVLPPLLILLPLVSGLIGLVAGYDLTTGIGFGLVLFTMLWLYRVQVKYPAIDAFDNPQNEKNTVLEALTSMEKDGYYEASPVRGKPIVLEGNVLGRGTPGFYLSEDFVVRDETGFMVVDFQSVIPLYNLWFGWRHVKEMMDTNVRVVGWYHRSIMPRVQLYKVYREDGKVSKNRWRGANRIFAFIVGIAGLYLLLSGLGI